MKRKQKRYIIIFILLFISLSMELYAKSGFEFLKISPSPACSSLGDACSSFYNNASSFYNNPAILCFDFPDFTPISPTFKTIDLYLSYIKYFSEMNYISFFSVLDVKGINRIGIGFTGLFYGDIDSGSYEGESYSTGNEMNINSYSFLIGYGYNITDKIGAGINVKLPVENLGDTTCLGIGGDIGGIYKEKNWSTSLVIQNIGMDIKKVEETHNLPMIVKIGGNYNFYLFKKRKHKITITADIGKEIEKDFIGGTGLQYGFQEIVFIRNGYYIKKEDVDIRLGCGLKYKNYQIDYGYKTGKT